MRLVGGEDTHAHHVPGLRHLVDDGYTMLLIDHDMGLVLSVCDQIHMLVFGELVTSGSPAEIRNDPAVISAYLGRSGAA